MKTSPTLLALAAAAICITPAVAKPAQPAAWAVGGDSYHLYYADLDTHTAAGRAELLARVERVATKLCEGGVQVEQRKCVADALAHNPNPDVQHALADRTSVASR
jgi:UrcA family protein